MKTLKIVKSGGFIYTIVKDNGESYFCGKRVNPVQLNVITAQEIIDSTDE